MKNRKLLMLSTFAAASVFSFVSCTPSAGGGSAPAAKFDFIPYLTINGERTSRTEFTTLEHPIIKADEINSGDVRRNYTYDLEYLDDDQYLTVSDAGQINPVKVTPANYTVNIIVTETKSSEERIVSVSLRSPAEVADGGYNFSGSAKDRAKALGELEGFAMKNFLTGISLFENGGKVAYSDRFNLGSDEYIPGYGFGLLSEGTVNDDAQWVLNSTDYPTYLHSGSTSDPKDINAWMATGSQVADLNSYITSSYYGTMIDNDPTLTKKAYKWYPILADCQEPIPLNANGTEITDEDEASTLSYKKWRIYVKTGMKYHKATRQENVDEVYKIDGVERTVELRDYEFVFKMLLTGGTQLKRGSELANDTSYGFKGAYNYFKQTEGYKNGIADEYSAIDIAWTAFKNGGGFNTGTNATGSYLDFEFINPLTRFYAKYNLSSNLYSPLPEEFLTSIGGTAGWIKGATIYGRPSDARIEDHVLSIGPYRLERWEKNSYIAYSRNSEYDNWFAPGADGRGMYNIPGVYIRIYDGASAEDVWSKFVNKEIDSSGIPNPKDKQIPEYCVEKETKGSSTFKLNVNSTDADRWDELFGKNGSIKYVEEGWDSNVWMSNYNFLQGLFWSIDRKEFADARGVEGSYNYFADSYLIDPIAGTSYNSTQAHKDAISDFFGENYDSITDENIKKYGYSEDRAIRFFQSAVSELEAAGKIRKGTSRSNPTYVDIRIEWMYTTDENEYGTYIEDYFKKAFNNDKVCEGKIQLRCIHHATANNWEAVYNEYLMKGRFDLGFGAISGNALNPLNFLEVLKSDNSSGFTLNWGADTGKLDPNNPIIFPDGNGVDKEWTFDALWAAADHGAVVANGESKKLVKNGYIDSYSNLDDESADNFVFGEKVTLSFEFLNVTGGGVTFTIDRLQLYLVGAGIEELKRGANVVKTTVRDYYYDPDITDPNDTHTHEITGVINLVVDEEHDEIRLEFSPEAVEVLNYKIFNGSDTLKTFYKDNLTDQEKADYKTVYAARQEVIAARKAFIDDPTKEQDYKDAKATYNTKVATWNTNGVLTNYKKVAGYLERVTMDNYYVEGKGFTWAIDVFYQVKIGSSDPVDSSHTILKDEFQQKDE